MTNNFVLMTDDSCDLPFEFYENNQIPLIKLRYTIDGTTYSSGDLPPKKFYDMLRSDKISVTTAANVEDIKTLMEPFVKFGREILYLGFSSGLSATVKHGEMAAEELRAEYPGCNIIVIDTLCASMGQGLLVFLANRLKQSGATIDEVAEWSLKNRLRMAHYVMADDLMHLHRGGRVSKASAIAGSMLGIKPIIHVDNEGRLIPIDKIRGKNQALGALVDKMEKASGNVKADYFMISHADCEEDAKHVASLMTKRFGIKDYMINFIGPVIGSHTGPGTLAVFMMSDRR